MIRWMLLVLAVVALFAVSGCGKPEGLGPPEIRLGQDTCHECGMAITDERYAAAVVVDQDGVVERFLFDDAGEMLSFAAPAGKPARWYVRDAATRQWVEAGAATFVKAEKLETPMGSGIAAYASAETAARVAKEHGGEVMRHEKAPGWAAAR